MSVFRNDSDRSTVTAYRELKLCVEETRNDCYQHISHIYIYTYIPGRYKSKTFCLEQHQFEDNRHVSCRSLNEWSILSIYGS